MTNTVYVADALIERHPDVYLGLETALKHAGIPLVAIKGTGNIWVRDWFPQRVGDHWVKFKCKYDEVKYPFLKVPKLCWNIFEGPIIESDIILDGGNIVRSPEGDTVIMTEQTKLDNPTVFKAAIAEALESDIIWIPPEPDDELGHADGVVAWIDEWAVFVNDVRCLRDKKWTEYVEEVTYRLSYKGLEVIPFPYAYDLNRDITEERFRREHPQADSFNSATGYYINFCRWTGPNGDLICYPTFATDRDERCLDCLIDDFPGCQYVGIDCTYLAEEGGLLHCVTAET